MAFLLKLTAIVISYSVPVLFWFYLRKIHHASAVPLIVGIISYSVLISLPRGLLRMLILTEDMRQNSVWEFYIIRAVFSGVFEEVGRYLVFKHLIPNRDSFTDCAAYALGHGGIEIILTHKMWENDIGMSLVESFFFAEHIAFSIALSVLVFTAVHYSENKRLLYAAVLIHTLFDILPAAYFSRMISVGALILIDLFATALMTAAGYTVYKHTE
ncbi:MAG: YhfC family intramembrane metalloprotease [Ruminococcus sp.]|nr:YhfC family intramembrane metalloprotease [Ruminococcus sp.]